MEQGLFAPGAFARLNFSFGYAPAFQAGPCTFKPSDLNVSQWELRTLTQESQSCILNLIAPLS